RRFHRSRREGALSAEAGFPPDQPPGNRNHQIESMKAAGASTEASQEIFMSHRPTKKNPFMSLWLSGANKVAGTGLGLWRAAARRQRSAMFRAADELSASYWNKALKTLSRRKRRNSGK